MFKNVKRKKIYGIVFIIILFLLFGRGIKQLKNVSIHQSEPVKIGFSCWGYSDRLGASYKRYFEYIEEAFGIEVIFKGGSDSIELQTKYVEELIEEDVDGIIGVRVTGEMMDKCEAAGIYLAQFGSAPREPELLNYLEESPYWIGYSTMDENDCGKTLIRSLYNAGVRNVVLCAQESSGGAPNERWIGFQEEADKYPDLKVVEEIRVSESSEFGAKIYEVLEKYPEVDGIASAQGNVGTLESIMKMLEDTGNIERIKVACADIEGDTKNYFDKGTLTCVAGGSYPEVIFLSLCMLDKINEVSTIDEAVSLKAEMIYLCNSSEYVLYTQYIDGEDIFPYTIEELKAVTTSTNSEATYKDMQDLWKQYSLDDVINRHNLQK